MNPPFIHQLNTHLKSSSKWELLSTNLQKWSKTYYGGKKGTVEELNLFSEEIKNKIPAINILYLSDESPKLDWDTADSIFIHKSVKRDAFLLFMVNNEFIWMLRNLSDNGTYDKDRLDLFRIPISSFFFLNISNNESCLTFKFQNKEWSFSEGYPELYKEVLEDLIDLKKSIFIPYV